MSDTIFLIKISTFEHSSPAADGCHTFEHVDERGENPIRNISRVVVVGAWDRGYLFGDRSVMNSQRIPSALV